MSYSALEHLDIRIDKLHIYGVEVTNRIDRAVDVNNIGALKAAYNMNNGIDLADVGEKLVSQTLTLGCALDKPCDVDKFDNGG